MALHGTFKRLVLQVECVSPTLHGEALTPSTSECEAFGDTAFKEVIKLK